MSCKVIEFSASEGTIGDLFAEVVDQRIVLRVRGEPQTLNIPLQQAVEFAGWIIADSPHGDQSFHPAPREDVQALVEAANNVKLSIEQGWYGSLKERGRELSIALRPFDPAEPLPSPEAIKENGANVE